MKNLEVTVKFSFEVDGKMEDSEVEKSVFALLNTMDGVLPSEELFDHENFALIMQGSEILEVKKV